MTLKFNPENPPFARESFHSELHHWYERHHRRLPWREKPTLYKTVVSEFMLQQTRIDTALDYFNRWMRALPDFEHLAAASENQVLKLWEGLGYYSRARRLRRLAGEITALPAIPTDAASWQRFPGIGPYTAAAVTSIHFNTPAACVDGNVVRILTRLTGDRTLYRDSASSAKSLVPLAEQLLDETNPGRHNQAMMELGATVCFPRKPACPACPVRRFCAAARGDNPEFYPRLLPKPTEKKQVRRLLAIRDGALLLRKAPPASRRLEDLYELPFLEEAGGGTEDLPDWIVFKTKYARTITRFRITELIYEAVNPPRDLCPTGPTESDARLAWVPVEDLPRIILSGPHRRWLKELLK